MEESKPEKGLKREKSEAEKIIEDLVISKEERSGIEDEESNLKKEIENKEGTNLKTQETDRKIMEIKYNKESIKTIKEIQEKKVLSYEEIEREKFLRKKEKQRMFRENLEKQIRERDEIKRLRQLEMNRKFSRKQHSTINKKVEKDGEGTCNVERRVKSPRDTVYKEKNKKNIKLEPIEARNDISKIAIDRIKGILSKYFIYSLLSMYFIYNTYC